MYIGRTGWRGDIEGKRKKKKLKMWAYTHTSKTFEMKVVIVCITLKRVTIKEENNAFWLLQESFMKCNSYSVSAQSIAHSRPLPSFCYLNYEISLQLCLLWKLSTLHKAYFSQEVEQSCVWLIGWLGSTHLCELVMWVHMSLLHLALVQET